MELKNLVQNKKALFFALFIILVNLLPDRINASEIIRDYDFSNVDFRDCQSTYDTNCHLWESELDSFAKEAFPKVPLKSARVLIPENEIYDGFRLETGEKVHIERRVSLVAIQKPLSLGADFERKIEKYKGGVFPETWYGKTTLQRYHGYDVLQLPIFPMRYLSRKKAVFIKSARLVVYTKKRDELPVSDGAGRKILRDYIKVAATIEQHPPQPLAGIVRPEEEIGYLIIGNRKILGDKGNLSLQELIEEKRRRHINVEVSYLEDVSPNLKPEEIREHIRRQYQSNYIDYVLLVGDKKNLPWKYIKSGIQGNGDPVPSDQYYACLDGDFSSPDRIDWACEVSVGRIGVRSWKEAKDWASKTIRLQDQIILDHNAKILNYGEQLDDRTLGGRSLDYVLHGTRKAPGTQGFPTDVVLEKIYDTFNEKKPYTKFVDALNSTTFRVVNHLGHAHFNYVFRMKVDALAEIKAVPAFYYSQGCYPNDPDKDNWTIKAVRMPTYGPAAMISNTRYGWYAPGSTDEGTSSKLHRVFWAMGFEKGIRSIGRMNHEAKRIMVEQDPSSLMVYTALESNLIGDPELDLAID